VDRVIFAAGEQKIVKPAIFPTKLNISVSLKINDIIFIRSQSRTTLTAINLNI
jgi:hypothetical protein